MDILILITLGLLVMCGVLIFLAERSRRERDSLQAQLDQALARSGQQRQLAYNDGLFEGWKHGWGESYSAACKAERLGLNGAEAVLRIGKQNAPALIGEKAQDVQVPNAV